MCLSACGVIVERKELLKLVEEHAVYRHRRQMLPKGRGVREGRLGSLGLADAN